MWNIIQSQEDADNLINIYGGFHDGCIKEMKYISGEYVNDDLGMMPINTMRKLSVIFQRQYMSPCVIEVIFSKLIRMNLSPKDEQYDGVIYGASLVINKEGITWLDYDGVDSENISSHLKDDVTWIRAKEMKWRIADNYIGKKEVYVRSR